MVCIGQANDDVVDLSVEEGPLLQSTESRLDLPRSSESPSSEEFLPQKAEEETDASSTSSGESGDYSIGILYEREDQQRRLKEVYDRLRLSRPKEATPQAAELCLITGPSGSGKSQLAQSLKQHVVRDGGLFVAAKFDQFQMQGPTRPFATLDFAFQKLVKLIMAFPQEQMLTIQETVKRAIGSEAPLLIETLPSLKGLLQLNSSMQASTNQDSTQAQSKPASGDTQKILASVFRRFLQAVASPSRPLIVFLDDLQWACPGSLNLLRGALQKEPRQTVEGGLLILGTCRSNEMTFSDSLSVMLRDLEDGGTNITEVVVGDLSQESLCRMIADRLEVEVGPELEEVAALLQRKTQGNVMFSLQYLQSLQEEGLVFRDRSGSWNWQTKEIKRHIISDSAVDELTSLSLVSHLEKKLRRLSPNTQAVLKVASCLGAEFDGNLLRMGAMVSLGQLEQALSDASEFRCINYSIRTMSGVFTHDKFLEAAYALIPDEEKPRFHYQIAKNVAEQAPQNFADNLLFIVNHALRGSESIESVDCRRRLAGLCLDAGRKTAKSSAFASSQMYFEAGIKELGDDLWKVEQYQLSLHLHNAAAEVSFCIGEHEKVRTFVDAIKTNARNFEDLIQAYSTEILSLTDLDMEYRLEAVELGMDLLNELGEKFPRKVGVVGTFMELMKTKRIIGKRTDADILNLPQMTDQRALGAMTILHKLYACLLLTDFTLAPIVGFRMCRLTMRKGLSPLSSMGFGFYASVLSRIGMADEAVRFGHLALVLMEKYPCSGFACDTTCTVWGDSMPHSISYRDCLEPIQESFGLGMVTGSTGAAMIAGYVDTSLLFIVGEPLKLVSEKILLYKTKCSEYGQGMMLGFYDILLQGCYNFQGKGTISPLILTGAVMEEDKMMERTSKEKVAPGVLWLLMVKYMLAVYFHEFEMADALREKIHKNMSAVVLPFLGTIQAFLEAFNSAVLSKNSRKHKSLARSSLKKLKAAAKMNPESLNNKVALAEAELARADGKFEKATSLYFKSIELASVERFIHEEALASERLGEMFIAQGKLVQAKRYLSNARALYEQWGSKPKVEQIVMVIAQIEGPTKGDEVISVFPK